MTGWYMFRKYIEVRPLWVYVYKVVGNDAYTNHGITDVKYLKKYFTIENPIQRL